MPPLRIGLFWDMEVLNIAIYAIAGFSLVLKKSPCFNTLSLRYFMIALLGLIPFLYNHNLYQQLFGAIQTQQGILGFVCLGVLAILFNTITRQHYYIALATVIFTTIWNLVSHPYFYEIFPDAYPFHFTSYVGGLCLFPLAYIIKTPTLPWRFAQLSLVLGCIILSFNKSLIGLLPLLGLLFFKEKIRLNKAVAATLVIAIPICFLAFNTLSFYKEGLYQDTAVYSSASRHISQRIPVLAFQNEPQKILTGFGLGVTGDLIQKHLTQLPIHLYDKGKRAPNWDGLNRIEFHTYNAFSEIFLQLGLLGLIALAMLWLRPIQSSSKKDLLPHTILLMLWAGHHSNWFIIPYQWVFDVLFLQTLLGNASVNDNAFGNRLLRILTPARTTALKITIGMTLILGALVQFFLLSLTNPIQHTLLSQYVPAFKNSPETVLRFKNTYHFPELVKQLNDNNKFSTDTALDFLQTVNTKTFSPIALIALNEVFELTLNKATAGHRPKILHAWGTFLLKATHIMPERFDLLYPFYLNLVEESAHKQIKGFSKAILKIAPDNPLARWFWNLEANDHQYVNTYKIDRWVEWRINH